MLLRRVKLLAILLFLCPPPLPAGEEMLTHKCFVKFNMLEEKKIKIKKKIKKTIQTYCFVKYGLL